ncbi:Uncharacterised protein [Legionella spiritensis]|nr:Uncharacterised protein [Legionella spiritensis]
MLKSLGKMPKGVTPLYVIQAFQPFRLPFFIPHYRYF